jgi:thiosulfate/3-mercaptopyruvate sulfurtransferase
MVLTGSVALIDPATLARLLAADDSPTVLDVRWRLGGPPGRLGYLAAHIPGARYIDLDKQLCGPPGPRGRHPLPAPGVLQKALASAGVGATRAVVAYDGGDGMAAARLWWTLRWAGHPQVSVLDGGFAAWMAAGLPVESGLPIEFGTAAATAPVAASTKRAGRASAAARTAAARTGGSAAAGTGDFVVRGGGMPTLDADSAAALPKVGVLLDVRAQERYRGEVEPIDAVAGHIAGAVNLPITQLTNQAGRLRPVDELREIFVAAGVVAGVPAGAYCGSGVAAAQAVLALDVAGFANSSLYVGSWSEWVADPSRPIAIGAQPGAPA